MSMTPVLPCSLYMAEEELQHKPPLKNPQTQKKGHVLHLLCTAANKYTKKQGIGELGPVCPV